MSQQQQSVVEEFPLEQQFRNTLGGYLANKTYRDVAELIEGLKVESVSRETLQGVYNQLTSEFPVRLFVTLNQLLSASPEQFGEMKKQSAARAQKQAQAQPEQAQASETQQQARPIEVKADVATVEESDSESA